MKPAFWEVGSSSDILKGQAVVDDNNVVERNAINLMFFSIRAYKFISFTFLCVVVLHFMIILELEPEDR